MVDIGSVITATVERIEPFGVWLKHGNENVLILIPDLAWTPVKDAQQAARIGETMEVYVLRYNYIDKVIVGSLRHLHPEQNPYRQLSQREPGEVLQGRIQAIDGSHATVVFANGAKGSLNLAGSASSLGVGDTIVVTISSLDVDQRILELKQVKLGAETANSGPPHLTTTGPLLSGSPSEAPHP